MIARIVASYIAAQKTKEREAKKKMKNKSPKRIIAKTKKKSQDKVEIPILDTDFKKGF